MGPIEQTTTHNKHRLGHSLIVAGLMSFLVFSFLLSSVSSLPAVAFGTNTIYELTNQARQENGLSSLELDEELTIAAQAKADAMVKDRYFEHTAPDGTTGWDYMEEADYEYALAGENLAASNEDDVAVVNGWLNSPGHRANLLNDKFSDIGLGMAFANQYGDYENVYFIVALYAKPSSSKTIAAGATTTQAGGLASFSSSRFTINSNLSYLVLSISSLLLIVGIGLELRKLRQHFNARDLTH